MSMVVQHNMQAANANRMLGVTTSAQSKSTEKLSSGYKINRAADDAAGLSISEKMRKQIRGLDKASSNAQDGVSAVQTAEGALTEVHSMLQRMNELATQAANGTNSDTDRSSIQDEIDQLTTEIDRVSETTKFNETYLLKGNVDGTSSDVKVAAHDAGLAGKLTDKGNGTTVFNLDKELANGDKVTIVGKLFAVVVDVDYVGKQQLKNLLKQFGNGVQLRPTYLVSSGKGVHLYYFLQEPVQLYRNREEVLAELKEAFIRRLWNDTSSIRPDSPDITGIYQGFRCVGSQSKLGVDFPVKAYKLSENRYTLEDIKASIPSCKVDLAPLYEKPRRKSTVTLEEAKELYPEWYEKRIVQGEPKQKSKKQGGTWVCNEALYEWWKRKITEEVKAGGRYFSIMALCSYGLKCGISEQKIRRDAYAFLDHLESLTEDEDNHFSRADVKDALRALKGDRKRLSTIASREWIEDNTKVTIPANKRNYRKQKDHVKVMNTMKALKKQLGEEVKEGRPKGSGTAEQTVREWQESHPAGKKADCIRETGLSKPTVYKWWK